MSCVDCYNNCGGNTLSDKCVKYTGPDITFLGIQTGDSLSLLEAAIIESLEKTIDGTGITLESLSLCSSITDALDGQDETLVNLLQSYADVICQLRTDVTTLQGQVDPSTSFVTPCLTLGTNPTRDQVLQATITKLCNLSTSVDSILADYVKNTELCTKVTACLASTVTQEYTKMPKYVAVPYHGPLSVFDGSGAGIASAGYDKVYICNGQSVGTFTTPDYRGRSPIGANVNIPGGTLDSNVDPSLPANAGYNFVNKTKNGSYTNTLTTSQIPSHTHTVSDPGHTHVYIETHAISYTGSPTSSISGSGANSPQNFNRATESATTGVTVNTSGGGQPHNNLHPVMGTVFIMYIP